VGRGSVRASRGVGGWGLRGASGRGDGGLRCKPVRGGWKLGRSGAALCKRNRQQKAKPNGTPPESQQHSACPGQARAPHRYIQIRKASCAANCPTRLPKK
jgi:hypothetical protein